ncbi:hypothetical protein [Gordonia caeni]
MKHVGMFCNVALVVAFGAGTTVLGVGEASAAPVPTVAVTTSGAADWQVTFDRGRAPSSARCVVAVGGRTTTPPEQVRTVVLPGRSVRAGAHPVRVRCGRSVSPTVWLHAPRNQVNDIGTWLSNGTAGIIGY